MSKRKKTGSGFPLLSRTAGTALCIVFAVQFSLHSQNGATEEIAKGIKDERKEWRVGFSSLEKINLSPENFYIADSIPLMMYGKLRAIGNHRLSPEERLGFGGKLKNETLVMEGRSLSVLLSQRDALYFSRDSERKKAADMEQTDKIIQESRERLEAISGIDPGSLSIPFEKPLVFWKDHSSGRLLRKEAKDSKIYSTANELDYLVFGGVEEIQDFLYFSLKGYDRASDSITFLYENAAAKDDINSIVEESSKVLASILIGGPWSSLSILAEPDTAMIFLDGTAVGRGKASIPYIDPGEKLIAVEAGGFKQQSMTVKLEPDSAPEINIKLLLSDVARIPLRSDPQGADAYIDSLWIGKTPIDVPQSDKARSGILRLEGYADSSFIIRENANTVAPIRLIAMDEGEKISFKQAKDDFYNSFGTFMVSLPISVFAYGVFSMYFTNVAQVYAGLNTSYTTGDWQNASAALNLPMYLSAGATIVSVGFSGWFLWDTVLKFVTYLQASRE